MNRRGETWNLVNETRHMSMRLRDNWIKWCHLISCMGQGVMKDYFIFVGLYYTVYNSLQRAMKIRYKIVCMYMILWNDTGYLKNNWTNHRLVCTHFDPFVMLNLKYGHFYQIRIFIYRCLILFHDKYINVVTIINFPWIILFSINCKKNSFLDHRCVRHLLIQKLVSW